MIKGKIIELVALSSEHELFMMDLINDQEIAYWEGRVEPVISIEKQRKWFAESLSSNNHYLIIRSIAAKQLLGYISFKITNPTSKDGHLAIKLVKEAHNKGIGTDALKTAMRYYFLTFNMHRLHSHIAEYNIASQKLFVVKCGWRKEGVAVKSVYINGSYYDNFLIALLKEEFILNEKDTFYNPISSSRQ